MQAPPQCETEPKSPSSGTAPAELDDEATAEIALLLSMHHGIKLAMYKENYVKRRIAIRMRASGCTDAGSYCHLLRSSPIERERLARAATIHVSSFFRNRSLFDTLRCNTLPYLFQAGLQRKGTPLGIYCLGSACGEEPYSMALLLKEHFTKELRHTGATITGIDIDQRSIEQACEALYTEERLRELPIKLRNHYFRHHDGRYRLTAGAKEMVTFRQGDITEIECYPEAQLILCRNTLIYFTRKQQEAILDSIAGSLAAGNILVLGKSETLVGATRRQFEAVNIEERIYQKK